jgi:hypothetical protein
MSSQIQRDFSLIAIGATYLREKKGLTNLYVCTTEKAYFEVLAKIKNAPGDMRAAFIFNASLDNEDEEGISHVLTVCVEKIGSTLKIFWLDSLGAGSGYQYKEHLSRYEGLGKIEFYVGEVERISSDRECMTFALRDGALFLQNPQFSNQIKFQRVDSPEIKHPVYHITHLPPSMMKGTQSFKILNDYLKTYPGNTQDLQQSIAKYSLPSASKGNKKRNYYIVERSLKYHHIALLAIQHLSAEQLQRVIAKSLLVEEQKARL